MEGISASFCSHGKHTPAGTLGERRRRRRASSAGGPRGSSELACREYTPYSRANSVIARTFSTVASFCMIAARP